MKHLKLYGTLACSSLIGMNPPSPLTPAAKRVCYQHVHTCAAQKVITISTTPLKPTYSHTLPLTPTHSEQTSQSIAENKTAAKKQPKVFTFSAEHIQQSNAGIINPATGKPHVRPKKPLPSSVLFSPRK